MTAGPRRPEVRTGHVSSKNADVAPLTFCIRMMASDLTKKLPTREYQSDTVCLPNVFMAGLAKCGSTFYYCFINKLLSMAGVSAMGSSALKEPRFWALLDPFRYSYIPKLDDVGYYLLNFLPGMNRK